MFFIAVCSLFEIALFADIVNVNKEAVEAYDSSKQEHVADAVWTEKEYIFFKVEVKYQEEGELERDGELMIARFQAVRKYVCTPFEKERMTVSPFGETMARFIVPDFAFAMNNVGVYTVYEDAKEDKCTRVYAFDKKQIDDLQGQIKKQLQEMKEWAPEKWAKLLADAYKSIKHEEDKLKVKIYLGCPLLNMIATGSMQYNGEKDELSKKACNELSVFLNSGPSGFYSAWNTSIWTMLWGTKGNMLFLQNGKEGKEEFSEAVSLYKKGKDLPRILELLKKSIELMPNDAEKWRYLGGSLIVLGKNPEALVAYIQAARLDPNNLDTLSKVSDLCAKCALPINAEGIKWYLAMLKK